jgi:hypothetical protein
MELSIGDNIAIKFPKRKLQRDGTGKVWWVKVTATILKDADNWKANLIKQSGGELVKVCFKKRWGKYGPHTYVSIIK